MINYQYEAYKWVRPIWTWLAIVLLAVITLGWGMMTHIVPDVPRHWDFGTLPDAPGQSPYSTVSPPQAKVPPLQIEMPPDYAGQDVNAP